MEILIAIIIFLIQFFFTFRIYKTLSKIYDKERMFFLIHASLLSFVFFSLVNSFVAFLNAILGG